MEIHKRKLYKPIGITTIILFFIGTLFISPLLIYATESLGYELIYFTTFEMLKFKISIGLLLALCSPVALSLSWAYSRKRSSLLTLTTFFVSLLIALVSSFLGLWVRLMEMKGILGAVDSPVPDIKISITPIHYFNWGLTSMLIICVPIIFILYTKKDLRE